MSRQTGLTKEEPRSLGTANQRPAVAPACDVYENDDEILVVADLPGIAADTLNINLEKGELLLAASRASSAKEGALLGCEWSGCDFQRRFAVPSGIDASKTSAELKDGVLHLHLPKSAALKPRQIAVRAG